MKRVTILKAAAHYEDLLQEEGFSPIRAHKDYTGSSKEVWGNHAYFMIRRVKLLIYTGHRDKAMRWLSYCQGLINGHGISSVRKSKIQLMPPGIKERKKTRM